MLVADRAGIQLLFLSNFTPWRAQGAQLFLKKTTTKPLHPRSIPSRTTLQPLEKRSIHRWHQQGGAVSGINHCAPSPPTTLHPCPALPADWLLLLPFPSDSKNLLRISGWKIRPSHNERARKMLQLLESSPAGTGR